jgi:hypothetical protein
VCVCACVVVIPFIMAQAVCHGFVCMHLGSLNSHRLPHMRKCCSSTHLQRRRGRRRQELVGRGRWRGHLCQCRKGVQEEQAVLLVMEALGVCVASSSSGTGAQQRQGKWYNSLIMHVM